MIASNIEKESHEQYQKIFEENRFNAAKVSALQKDSVLRNMGINPLDASLIADAAASWGASLVLTFFNLTHSSVSAKEVLKGTKIPEEQHDKYILVMMQNRIKDVGSLGDKDKGFLINLGIKAEDADAIITQASSNQGLLFLVRTCILFLLLVT